MRILKSAAVVLFVVAVPLFLIASNVRWVINVPFLYTYGFDKYDIVTQTGIERSELIGAGRQFRDYFSNDEEYLDLKVVQNGIRRSLLNSKEVLHMRDVKVLVKGVYRIQEVAGAYLAAFMVLGLIAFGRGFLRSIGRYAAVGGVVTVALIAVVGLASLGGFERLFLAFHQVGFSNDLWQLDPRTDYLVVLFPEGFFLDATMWIAGSTVVEGLLLTALPLALRMRKRPPKAMQIEGPTPAALAGAGASTEPDPAP